MTTPRGLKTAVGLPIGAIVHYALAYFATTRSAGLLELGPSMVKQLWRPIEGTEAAGGDGARLTAYREVRGLISWLRVPLSEDGDSTHPNGKYG